jgi:hypothetical protein
MIHKNFKNVLFHQDILAASFYHQVAACAQDLFCNFYFVKHHKIANNSTTTEAR